MHCAHQYMVQLEKTEKERKNSMCEKYKKLLISCNELERKDIYETICENIDKYCYNSFSNKAICSSVNSCGVTLK
jgi:hypothetical protein